MFELVNVVLVVPVGELVLPVPLSVQLKVYVVPVAPPLRFAVRTPPGQIFVDGVTVIVGCAENDTDAVDDALQPFVVPLVVTVYVLVAA